MPLPCQLLSKVVKRLDICSSVHHSWCPKGEDTAALAKRVRQQACSIPVSINSIWHAAA